ncbi:MAG: TolC family protein, partial [Gammaproteobacteria bacterium]|nr:TolC family protein [Gammaproteobacteria bacterium]
MKITLISALALAMAVLAAPASKAESLWEVYELALENDPQIREAEANRRAALENKPQALANLLPNITLTANEQTDQDSDGTSSFFDSDTLTNVTRPFDQSTEQTSISVQLRQPLFNWDNWVRLRQANSQVAQAEADYQSALQDLIIRVSETYFDLLAAIDSLEAAVATREAIGRQLDQAKKRFEVGLIAITDVQESQSGFDNAVAGVIAAERSVATARENLRALIGIYIERPASPTEDLPLLSPDPENQDEWVNRAFAQNLQLISSRLSVDISGDEIARRRAEHYPTLDLVATKNRFDQQQLSIIEGIASPSGTDSETETVQLQLSVPIFGGGAIR